MIEVTLPNTRGRTTLYPGSTMSRILDHGDVNIPSALTFFGPEAESIQLNPQAVVGECRVVDYTHVGECISLGDIEFIDVKYKERILVKTPTDRFVYLHRDAANHLESKDIELFGMDAVMQGENDRLEFTTHRKFKDQGIAVIEGLDLSEIQGGRYFLIGLPARHSLEPQEVAGGPTGLVQPSGASARVYLIPL